MATTYFLIASSAPTSDATSVVFSSIPQTYSDLVVRWSPRGTGGGVYEGVQPYINNTNATHSMTRINGDGFSGVISSNNSSYAEWFMNNSANNGASTASVFSNHELYIPNYTSTTVNKCAYLSSSMGTLSNVSYINIAALLKSDTAAVTSIGFGSGYATGTTFYLYGINNS